MSPERAPSTPPTFEDLYRAYAAELPKWLHRYRLSAQDLEDVVQEAWLAVSASPERIPTYPTDARKELRRIASNIARTMQRRAARNADRHDYSTQPDELQGQLSQVEQLDNVDELMTAIDQLDAVNRALFIAHKILGHPCPEISAMTGLGEDTVLVRVWNACAQIRKKLGQPDERKNKRGVVIAPTELEIAPETRAAMCALWSIEGTMPQFGGPKDPPPPPPPWFSPVSFAVPVVPSATKAAVSRAALAILLLLLMLTSAGTVAIYYFWDPLHPDTARAGLRVPQTPVVGEVKDVVDVYPAPSAAAPSAGAIAPKTTPKTRQTLDDGALDKLDGPGLSPLGSGSD